MDKCNLQLTFEIALKSPTSPKKLMMAFQVSSLILYLTLLCIFKRKLQFCKKSKQLKLPS